MIFIWKVPCSSLGSPTPGVVINVFSGFPHVSPPCNTGILPQEGGNHYFPNRYQ
jgi:hypothetical protein